MCTALHPAQHPAGAEGDDENDQHAIDERVVVQKMRPGKLIDHYGRHVTYVRLSVTDRCDFRCTYCMAEEMTFLPREEVMSLEESLRVARYTWSLLTTPPFEIASVPVP